MAERETPEERTCPGYHRPENPAPALRPDEYLCRRCVDRTTHTLEDLLGDLLLLDQTETRQAVLTRGGRHRLKGDEQPMPFNAHASRRRAEIDGLLYEWAHFVAERRGAPIPKVQLHQDSAVVGEDGQPVVLASLARPQRVYAIRSLLEARSWLHTDPQGPALANAVRDLRHKISTVVDRHEQRWSAGPCHAPIVGLQLSVDEHGNIRIGTAERCEFELYAKPGSDVIVCDGYRDPDGGLGCGTSHEAVRRKQFLIKSMEDEWLPLDLILPALPTLLGVNPSGETVKKWKQRGKLKPVVVTDAQIPLYRGGDVMDLAADVGPRPGPRRRDVMKA